MLLSIEKKSFFLSKNNLGNLIDKESASVCLPIEKDGFAINETGLKYAEIQIGNVTV